MKENWCSPCIRYHIGYHTERAFNFHCIPFNTIKLKLSHARQVRPKRDVRGRYTHQRSLGWVDNSSNFLWKSVSGVIFCSSQYSLLLVVQGWVVCCRKYVGADIGIVSTKNFPGSTCLLTLLVLLLPNLLLLLLLLPLTSSTLTLPNSTLLSYSFSYYLLYSSLALCGIQ